MPINKLGYAPYVSRINFGQNASEVKDSKSMLMYGSAGGVASALGGATGGYYLTSHDKDSFLFARKVLQNSASEYDKVIEDLEKIIKGEKVELQDSQKAFLKLYAGVDSVPEGGGLKDVVKKLYEGKAFVNNNAEEIKTFYGAEDVARLNDLLKHEDGKYVLRVDDCNIPKFLKDNAEVVRILGLTGTPSVAELTNMVQVKQQVITEAMQKQFDEFNTNFLANKDKFIADFADKVKATKESADVYGTEFAKKVQVAASDIKGSNRNKWAIYLGVVGTVLGGAYAYFTSPTPSKSEQL